MNINKIDDLYNIYLIGKISHAYLISTNNVDKTIGRLLNVIKNIFCSSESNKSKKDSLYHLIDLNNLPSLKLIEPDGQFIKKEQIINLKNAFAKESIYTKESIYIIKNAEKLNKEAANTMLKFLEEPEGNVIGFFITETKENVMLTIQSRCQMINDYQEVKGFEKFGISEEKYNIFISILKDYLVKIETQNKNIILDNQKILNQLEKDEIVIFLKIILDIYKQYLTNNNLDKEYKEFSFIKSNNIENIKKKLDIITEILKEIRYNVNVLLLLDRFVLEMAGVNNEII